MKSNGVQIYSEIIMIFYETKGKYLFRLILIEFNFFKKLIRIDSTFFSANEELSLIERFSKSHSEREKILQQRKESMLTLARKR